jgi:hypothetical protein
MTDERIDVQADRITFTLKEGHTKLPSYKATVGPQINALDDMSGEYILLSDHTSLLEAERRRATIDLIELAASECLRVWKEDAEDWGAIREGLENISGFGETPAEALLHLAAAATLGIESLNDSVASLRQRAEAAEKERDEVKTDLDTLRQYQDRHQLPAWAKIEDALNNWGLFDTLCDRAVKRIVMANLLESENASLRADLQAKETEIEQQRQWINKVCAIVQPAQTAEEWGADVADILESRLAQLESENGELKARNTKLKTGSGVADTIGHALRLLNNDYAYSSVATDEDGYFHRYDFATPEGYTIRLHEHHDAIIGIDCEPIPSEVASLRQSLTEKEADFNAAQSALTDTLAELDDMRAENRALDERNDRLAKECTMRLELQRAAEGELNEVRQCYEASTANKRAAINELKSSLATITAQAEQAKGEAVEMALAIFKIDLRQTTETLDDWAYAHSEQAREAALYLASVGLLEKHPEYEYFYRLLPATAKEERGDEDTTDLNQCPACHKPRPTNIPGPEPIPRQYYCLEHRDWMPQSKEHG